MPSRKSNSVLQLMLLLFFHKDLGWTCSENSSEMYVKQIAGTELRFQAALSNGNLVYKIWSPTNVSLLTQSYFHGSVFGKLYLNDTYCKFIGNLTIGKLDIELNENNTGGDYWLEERSSTVHCITVYLLGKPTVPTISKSADPSVGGNVTLTCLSTSLTTPSLALVYNWIVGDVSNPSELRYTYSASRKSVTLSDVTKNDEGKVFKCTASEDVPSGYTSDESISTSISVLYGPDNMRFNPTKTLYEVEEKLDMKEVTCIADCNPRCNFSWKKKINGEQISNTDILQLRQLNKSDAGIYTCTAARAGSSRTSELTVYVIYGPYAGSTYLEPKSSEYFVNESGTVPDITCHADCYPNCTYTWTKHLSDRDTEAAQKAVLALGTVQRNASAKYICSAVNPRKATSSMTTAEVTVMVYYGPDSCENLKTAYTYTEGESAVEIRCPSDCYPNCTFAWIRNSSTVNSSSVFFLGTVDRHQAGSYMYQAHNLAPTYARTFQKTFEVIIEYPPDVVVEGPKTAVMSESLSLMCKANGIPSNNYSYGEWVQEWPGNHVVVARRLVGPTLTIPNLTYEHSGIYKCRASNGIKVFGTNQEYKEGSLELQVSSSPIRIGENTSTEDPTKVSGRLNRVAETAVEYYSVSKLTVECYKVQNGSRQISLVCSTSKQNATVTLNVFSQNVSTPGIRINISVKIESKEVFGIFELNVTNDIGSSLLKLEIVPEGPPEAPQDIQIDSIHAFTVIVSWLPGFHGGFDQTVYVQTSKDGRSWVNKTSVPLGRSLLRTPATLESLESDSMYFLRMFAYNLMGRSGFSEIRNFTTMQDEDANEKSQMQAAAIGGGIGSAVVVLAVVAVLIIIWRRSANKDHGIHTKLKESGTGVHGNNSDDEDVEVENPMYVSAGPRNKQDDAVYAKANKKSKTETKNSDVYAVVNKPNAAKKKKKAKQTKSQQAADVDIYENAPKTSENANTYGNAAFENTPYETAEISAKAKKTSNPDDLMYADLAFSKPPKGKKLEIHGLDDRTPYAQVDFSKHAEPLPESDTEEPEQTPKK